MVLPKIFYGHSKFEIFSSISDDLVEIQINVTNPNHGK